MLVFSPGCLASRSSIISADDLSLQVVLRTAEVTGEDGEALRSRESRDVLLGAVDERADHDVPLLRHELRRHRRELTREEQIQEERLKDVVAVVAEGDLRTAELRGDPVENPAA